MTRTLRIVFVCSGNICRSPLAEAMARPLFAEANIPAVLISQGTLGLQGRSAAAHSIATAAEIGVDLSSHRSQGVSLALMRMADRIVVMAPRHEDELLRNEPALAPKIVRLWEYVDEDIDSIPDPIGKDIQTFRKARDLIQKGLTGWIESIRV